MAKSAKKKTPAKKTAAKKKTAVAITQPITSVAEQPSPARGNAGTAGGAGRGAA